MKEAEKERESERGTADRKYIWMGEQMENSFTDGAERVFVYEDEDFKNLGEILIVYYSPGRKLTVFYR